MAVKVGVLAPETSWHYRDLMRAAKCLDESLELCSVDFKSLAVSVGGEKEESFFDRDQHVHDLRALIVRTMPAGSLQQVVFRMDLLHRLSNAGVKIFNSPRSVEIAIDKYLSLALMASEGISVPDFAVCQTLDQGMETFRQLGCKAVLKPIFGSMGKNLHLLENESEARVTMEKFLQKGEVLYLQRFVDHGGSDIRILVVGNQTFSMRRVSPDGGWLTNISRGAIAEPYEATSEEKQLAIKVAKSNACKIAGVDMAYENGTGSPLVLELNASPGWQAIQKVCEVDVASSVLSLITTQLG